MRAIDADGHVQEPTEEIARLLPAQFRDCAPRAGVDDAGRIRQIVGGEWMPYIPVPDSGKWEIPAGGHDSKQRLADMGPSDYFARRCFISCDPGERALESVVALCGEDVVVFATDYPHPDALAGDVVGRITSRPGLSESAKAKILRANAQRCFGLEA